MAHEQLEIPARIELPSWHKSLCYGLMGLGVVGGIVGAATDFTAFQTGYLAAFGLPLVLHYLEPSILLLAMPRLQDGMSLYDVFPKR